MAAGSTRACDRIGPMEEGEGGGGDRTFLGQLLFHPGSLARRVVRPGIVLGIGQSRFSVSRDPWRCAEFDISREGNRPESSFPRDKPGPLFTGRHFPPLVLRDSKRKKTPKLFESFLSLVPTDISSNLDTSSVGRENESVFRVCISRRSINDAKGEKKGGEREKREA